MKSMLIFVIVCACISSAFGIECYDCESKTHLSCDQFFDSERAPHTNCDDADMPAYLHKYERRIAATGCLTKVHKGFDNLRYYIRRSCYFGDPEDTTEACDAPDSYVPFADLLTCSVCTEDLCNVHTLNEAHHAFSVWGRLALLGLTLTTMALNSIREMFQ